MGGLVAPPQYPALRWANVASCSQVRVKPPLNERISFLRRYNTQGIIAYCMVFPVVQIGVIASARDGGYGRAAWALVATAAFSPFYIRLVRYGIRGTPPPGAAWALAAMTLVIVGVAPLAGAWWLPTFSALTVSVLIALPWRWSLPLVAALVAVQVPLSLALPSGVPLAASYFALTLVWRTSAVFVPIWLVGTLAQLEAARRALADDAVLRERLIVDADLQRTIGAGLSTISDLGQRAAAFADRDPTAIEEDLASLVDTSRRTLADARQLLRRYYQPSLWSELHTAANLITAAGIETRLVLPPGEPPNVVLAGFRAQLQAITTALLREESVRTCVITVISTHGQMELQIDVDNRHLASLSVSAP
jgi:two-component system sensor histidine kinase DesK